MNRAKQILFKPAALVLETSPRRNPMEWARAVRVLGSDSAEPGKFRPERTPYFIPIADAFISSAYSRIVVTCGTQMAKTEFCLNCVGSRMDDSPAPALWVCPTQRLVEITSQNRVAKMVASVPTLWAKLAKGKRDKITEKYFAGVRLGFAWSSSANELSSNPAAIVVLDERDRMDNDVQGEGDPVEICQGRTATFPDSKLLITSTPTIEGASPIWSLWEEGTRYRWNIPCPKCNGYFTPRLSLLKWEFENEKDFKVSTAYLLCPFCEFKIEDKHRLKMNANGIYISDYQTFENGKIQGEVPRNKTASYWISGLCSPWRTYFEAAESFSRATKSNEPGRVQASVNTIFGELWKIKGDKPTFEQIFDLACDLEQGQLPQDTLCLTCGIDVQKDSIYYVIRAWGYRGESWTVEYGQLFTSRGTEDAEIWGDVQEKILDYEWEVEEGIFKIRFCAIDSSYHSHTVYFFCQTNPGITIPVKGKDKLTTPVKTSKVEVNFKGQHIPGGTILFSMDDYYFKSLVHSKVRRGKRTGPEAWHLPKDVDEEFCKQILSEELVTKATGGKIWAKTYANHFLDCEKQNEVCGYILQTAKFRESRKDQIDEMIEESTMRLISKGIK